MALDIDPLMLTDAPAWFRQQIISGLLHNWSFLIMVSMILAFGFFTIGGSLYYRGRKDFGTFTK